MRSTLLIAAVAPALVAAAPPTQAKLTDFSFSGNGCPGVGDVKSSLKTLGDTAHFNFKNFKGDSSTNCQVHLQGDGGSEGWQFALKDVEYRGDVVLKPGSSLKTLTTSYFSQDAANTSTLKGDLVCNVSEIKDSFALKSTVGDAAWSPCSNSAGYTGIMTVNFRPTISGNGGSYNIKSTSWNLAWRKC